MLVYFILLLVPVAFRYIVVNKSGILKYGNSSYIDNNNFSLYSFFIIYYLLLALRSSDIGSDTENYLRIFSLYDSISFMDAMNLYDFKSEYAFKALNWILKIFIDNPTLYLAVIAFFSIYPISELYAESRQHSILIISIYINLSTFVIMFSGIRQGIAIGIGCLAYKCVRNRNPIQYLCLCLLAYYIHHSAIILLIMYPLYNVEINKKILYTVTPFLIVSFFFRDSIFLYLVKFTSYYNSEITITNAYTILIILILFLIISYTLPINNKMSNESKGLRNLIILMTYLQFFASVHPLAMRFNYYYLILLPYAIGRILSEKLIFKYSDKTLMCRVISVSFFVIFIYSAFKALYLDTSVLHTIPYKFFWN